MLTNKCLTLIEFEWWPVEIAVYHIAKLLLASVEIQRLSVEYGTDGFRMARTECRARSQLGKTDILPT